jgi:hypothetical protein
MFFPLHINLFYDLYLSLLCTIINLTRAVTLLREMFVGRLSFQLTTTINFPKRERWTKKEST